MILADKIIELRKKNGMSQEDLAGLMNVSRQSVSKWESAQAVPDLNKIIMLSQIFGVSTDFLVKDDMAFDDVEYIQPEVTVEENEVHPVSMEEANAFLDLNEKQSFSTAFGVALCILSPVVMMILAGLSEIGKFGLAENVAAGAGVCILLIMVACGVAIFITSSMKMKRFEYLNNDVIETAYGVSGMVKERKDKYAHKYTRELVIGIVLCVLSAVPLMAAIMISDTDMFAVVGVSMVLVFVAVGTFFIVKSCCVWGGFQKLLEEDDYSRIKKANNKNLKPVMNIYWGLVTTLYLAYSFITFDWARSWVIWPVAAVLSPAVKEVAKMIRK